jgi:glutamate-1-semialdehyde 2,1-aminomutase
MVRYARSGGEALAVAVRLARAATGKDIIAFCGYHGWSDWYLAANLGADALTGHLLPGLSPAGVPQGLEGSALPFTYNRLDELDRILATHPDRVGAIVMEPRRRLEPAPGFLEGIRDRATARKIPLVFDEVTAGWRLNSGGVHLILGIDPDIAVFAKGISNGYPMAAVLGREQFMNAAQETFVSSTFWTERIGPTAALATIRKHQALDAGSRMVALGEQVQASWREAAAAAGLAITIGGMPPLAFFTIDHPEAQVLRTYFTRRMLEAGFLATNAFYAMCAHTEAHINSYRGACTRIFGEVQAAIDERRIDRLIDSPVAHAGFARLA